MKPKKIWEFPVLSGCFSMTIKVTEEKRKNGLFEKGRRNSVSIEEIGVQNRKNRENSKTFRMKKKAIRPV